MINVLDNVDLVPSNVRVSHQEALLFVFEDNEAAIKMIFKGRSPTMRHVSRTHRVVRSNQLGPQDPSPVHRHQKNQLADILTKGNFTRDEWNHLLCLFNISHFSSAECSEVMSKRPQKESGEESANTIPLDTEIHEQMTMTNGYVKVCTTTNTPSTTVRPLWTIT